MIATLSEDARRHLGRGFNWLGGASIAARVIDLLTVMSMLLLLTKREVGIGSLAVSIGTVIEAFNGLGTGDALVQARRVSRSQRDAVFVYAFGASALVGAATLLAAPLIGRFYGLPALGLYLAVIAAKIPLVGAAVVPLATLSRELRFRRIAAINLAATLGAALTRLSIAEAGGGAAALVFGYAASGLFIVIGAQLASPTWPRGPVRLRSASDLFRFGLRSTLANGAEQMFKNIDYLLVGSFYGAIPLATYRLAFDVAMEPPLAVATIVNRTALPVLAREATERGDLTPILAWSLGKILSTVAPLLVGVAFAASPLTTLLHDAAGRPYTGAAAPLEILAVAALLRVLFQPLSTVLVAAGRPGMAARLSLATLVLLGGGVALIGVTLPEAPGLVAVSLLWLAVYPMLTVWAVRSLGRVEAISLRPLLRATARPAEYALGLALVLGAVNWGARGTVPPRLGLAVAIAATAGCYALLVLSARRGIARASS